MNKLNLFAESSLSAPVTMDKRMSLWYNLIRSKKKIRTKPLALMVMWLYRVFRINEAEAFVFLI